MNLKKSTRTKDHWKLLSRSRFLQARSSHCNEKCADRPIVSVRHSPVTNGCICIIALQLLKPTTFFMCVLSNAVHISSSEYWLKGSRLYLTVPTNNTGSCGMMERFCRRSWRWIFPTLTLSISILPPFSSTRRNRAVPRDDLPRNTSKTSSLLFYVRTELDSAVSSF